MINEGLAAHSIQPRIRSRFFGITNNNEELQLDSSDTKTILEYDLWSCKGTVEPESTKSVYDINYTIAIIEMVVKPTPFDVLHEDTTLTDFELSGQDGSIDMHRSVLAASSPVLYTMLTGEWKETTKGKVELAGITKETLTNLKAFVYLKKLPYRPKSEEGIHSMHRQLEDLLKLACYLMMSDLVAACSAQFLLDLTDENAYQLLSLAAVYKLKTLTRGILLSHQHALINLIEHSKFPVDWI